MVNSIKPVKNLLHGKNDFDSEYAVSAVKKTPNKTPKTTRMIEF